MDTANSINYAVGSCSNGATSPTTGACYTPNGSVAQAKNGTNLVSTYIYNTRFQPCWMYGTTGTALATNTTCTASDPGPGNILDLQYNFNLGAGDNGNVVGITNKRDSTRTQSFTYDQLNRIVTAKTSSTSGSNCWGETYTIDQWANLTAIGAVSGYTGCTQENLSVTATTKNQLSATGFSYDTSGNMLNDGAHAYAYNAESEIKSAAGVNYTYDGDGNRIKKSSGKVYWYGAGTEILDESDTSGNITNEYVFFGGKRIAMRNVSSGTIYYYEDDMLGSARTIVQAGQTSPCYDGDFYPFGGERIVTNTCTQNYKFEGKERDTETGNDDFGARYYTSRLGRWLSADWSSVPAPVPYANLTNPQTLNLYAMVNDNPETFADLDGHTAASISIDVLNSATGGACGVTAEDASSPDKMCLLNLQSYWNDTKKQTQANEANNESTQKGSTPPPKKAQQQNVDNQTVGKTTVGDLSKVLTNEIGSLNTPKGGDPSELQKGADALANALINNANKAKPNEVAPDTGTASPQLAKAMQAAYTNRANGGADPVHGRTFYGTSHIPPSRLHSRPIGSGRQTVYQHFGPFRDSTSRLPTYIYIYNDPGH